MSENLEIVQSVYKAFAVGDIPSVLNICASDIEWTEAEGGPCGGIYVGPDAILQNVFMVLGTEWQDFTATPSEYEADGSTVITLGEYAATYKATGKSFKAPFAHVWKFKDGKAISFHQFTDTAVHLRPMQI